MARYAVSHPKVPTSQSRMRKVRCAMMWVAAAVIHVTWDKTVGILLSAPVMAAKCRLSYQTPTTFSERVWGAHGRRGVCHRCGFSDSNPGR